MKKETTTKADALTPCKYFDAMFFKPVAKPIRGVCPHNEIQKQKFLTEFSPPKHASLQKTNKQMYKCFSRILVLLLGINNLTPQCQPITLKSHGDKERNGIR